MDSSCWQLESSGVYWNFLRAGLQEKLESQLVLWASSSHIFRKPVVSIKLERWNCTKILITSSKVCNWTRKTFWVNVPRSLSQVRETVYTSQESTCIEATGNPFSLLRATSWGWLAWTLVHWVRARKSTFLGYWTGLSSSPVEAPLRGEV